MINFFYLLTWQQFLHGRLSAYATDQPIGSIGCVSIPLDSASFWPSRRVLHLGEL
jgi:hypothetical protein